jgi:anti-sigma factor RsiW
MTDCPNGDIRDLLPDLLHGRLNAGERARVERHVASCEACTTELALLGSLRSTMHRAPVVDAAAVAASIPAYRAPLRQRTWGGWRAAAAIAAITVGGTSIALMGRESRPAASGGSSPVAATASESIAVAYVPPSVPSESIAASSSGSGIAAPAPAAATVQAVAEPVSLAMTGGAIGELSDRELSTFVNELETLDALPSEEPESAGALSSTVPLEQSR